MAAGAGLAAALGLALPLFSDWAFDNQDLSLLLAMTALVGGSIGGMLWHGKVAEGRGDVLAPSVLFPAVFFLFYQLGFAGSFATRPEEALTRPLGVAVAGLASYLVGCLLSGWRQSRESPESEDELPICVWPVERLRNWVVLLFLAGATGMLLFFFRAGVPVLGESLSHARVSALRGGGGPLWLLGTTGNMAIICGFFLVTHPKAGRAVRTLTVALGLAMLVLLAGTGTRNVVLFSLPALVMLFHYRVHRLSAMTLSVSAFMAVAGATMLSVARSVSTSEFTEVARTWFDVEISLAHKLARIGQGFFGVDAANYAYVLSLFPDHHPFMHGGGMWMNLSVVAPGTQQSLPEYLRDLVGLSFTGFGMPPGLLGGFYLEFGLAGVVVGMAMLGFVLQRLYSRMRSFPSEGRVMVYAVAMTVVLTMFKNSFLGNLQQYWYGALTAATVLLLSYPERNDSTFSSVSRNGSRSPSSSSKRS